MIQRDGACMTCQNQLMSDSIEARFWFPLLLLYLPKTTGRASLAAEPQWQKTWIDSMKSRDWDPRGHPRTQGKIRFQSVEELWAQGVVVAAVTLIEALPEVLAETESEAELAVAVIPGLALRDAHCSRTKGRGWIVLAQEPLVVSELAVVAALVVALVAALVVGFFFGFAAEDGA